MDKNFQNSKTLVNTLEGVWRCLEGAVLRLKVMIISLSSLLSLSTPQESYLYSLVETPQVQPYFQLIWDIQRKKFS